VYGGNLRLDQHPSINPTSIQGTYVVDIEGVVACPAVTFFDQPFSTVLFFDSGITVTTPQFPMAIGVVAATGLAALVLIRKRLTVPTPA